MSEDKSKADEIREEFTENAEEIDAVVDVTLTIADQMIDKHGEDFGRTVGKLVASYVVPALAELNKSKLSEEAAQSNANFVDEVFKRLQGKGFNAEQAYELTLGIISRQPRRR